MHAEVMFEDKVLSETLQWGFAFEVSTPGADG
jgi:hypothetical protein